MKERESKDTKQTKYRKKRTKNKMKTDRPREEQKKEKN